MVEDAKPGGLYRVTPVGMSVTTPAAQAGASAETVHASSTHDVKSIIADNSCISCHRIGEYGGQIGPSLNGVGTRLTEDQIRAAIVYPPPTTSAGVPNPMPSYEKKITGDDLKSLVHYLSTLPAVP
jgi:mono/diheme cytochrome c family protein